MNTKGPSATPNNSEDNQMYVCMEIAGAESISELNYGPKKATNNTNE